MELAHTSSNYLFHVLLFLFLFHQSSRCQQEYIKKKQLDCYGTSTSITLGFACTSSSPLSCQSYVSFRSKHPYNSPDMVATLLGSTASEIASVNKVPVTHTFPADYLIIVPISCTCWGSFYEHYAASPYVSNEIDESFYTIANDTLQGLTSCQRLIRQNNLLNEGRLNDHQELRLMIPVRCACPTSYQNMTGVTSLMVYLVTLGDSIESIAESFGATPKSILDANMLSTDDLIFPFTPLLVPLKSESCKIRPQSFFCPQDRKPFPAKFVAILGVGTGLGFLCMFLFSYRVFQFLKKRRNRIIKEKFFKQNGGMVLQERFLNSGTSDRAKLFNSEELQRATDNYNPNRILGRGGYGTVYKGMLPDGGIVAVKRPKAIDEPQTQQFINEVFILSQISHRNIVKLLGCCLETEVPLLVYEFINNGTLSQHIHNQGQRASLSWEHRIRIVCEVAGAIAYMHSAASLPIFHRDIKTSNILLDENYNAKVSDFGTSRTVPYDKTHLTTLVQGTFGYLDPLYFHSGQYTEKSDVYSFGVVLIEILTGEKPVSFARAEDEVNLVTYFTTSAKEDKLLDILDRQVAGEARIGDVYAIANLAVRCLRQNGKKRPTMKEVAMELEGLRNSDRFLEMKRECDYLFLDDEDAPWSFYGCSGVSQSMVETASFSFESKSTSISQST